MEFTWKTRVEEAKEEQTNPWVVIVNKRSKKIAEHVKIDQWWAWNHKKWIKA